MTVKEMKRVLVNADSSLYDTDEIKKRELYARLQDKPFWLWDVATHKAEDRRTKGDCCFNHIIGLPVRGNREYPMFDYEQMIYDLLDKEGKKYLWIKKASGLGITEFFLRYIAWLCCRNNDMQGKRVCVVTGPRIDLAVTLIDRLRGLFLTRYNITFDSKETLIEINGCTIEVFPSHHLDAMRGLTNVELVLLDEADFFPVGQQQNARDVAERYIAKSGSQVKIVMVSTPNAPSGLFESIEHEEPCMYTKLKLDYTYGLGKIYSEQDIKEAMTSPSFSREYALAYGGLIGNVLSENVIQHSLKLGEGYDPYDPAVIGSPYNLRAMGIDPAFGSSKFAIVVTQLVTREAQDVIEVLLAEQHDRPDYQAMVDRCLEIMRAYGFLNHDIRSPDSPPVFIDASSSGFIRSLRAAVGLDPEYEGVIQKAKRAGFKGPLDRFLGMVRPRAFGAGEGRKMLSHMKTMFDNGYVAVHPSFSDMIIALRSAYAEGDSLIKDRSSNNDLWDAAALSLYWWRLQATKTDNR
jgi:hypothetical protein